MATRKGHAGPAPRTVEVPGSSLYQASAADTGVALPPAFRAWWGTQPREYPAAARRDNLATSKALGTPSRMRGFCRRVRESFWEEETFGDA